MQTLYYEVDSDGVVIPIGRVGENEVTQVVFDVSSYIEAYGSGTVELVHRRKRDSVGYVCENVTLADGAVTWVVTSDDTGYLGQGKLQVRWYVDDALKKSAVFNTMTGASVTSTGSAPQEVRDALELILDYVNDNTISIEDLDERIANYFDEHPIPAPVTSVNELTGDVVITPELLEVYTQDEVDDLVYGTYPYDTASGAIASFPDGAEVPVKDLVIGIEPVQAGSGDPSPDNIRAISGWTGATLYHKGKNLLPNTGETATSNGVTFTVNSDGTVTVNGTATANTSFYIAAQSVVTPAFQYLKGLPVTCSGCPEGGSTSTYFMTFARLDGSFKYDYGDGVDLTVGDVTSVNSYVRIDIKSGCTAENLVFKPMIRPATDADDTYKKYASTEHPVSWSDEAGTIYGGTLDLTTGVLTKTYSIVNMESLNWDYTTSSGGYFYANIISKKPGLTNFICSVYKISSATSLADIADCEIRGNATGNRLYAKDADYSTASEFVEAVTGQKICYELASPTTYSLTAQEISTLLGTNNIYADCGDTTVTYRADPTLYIAKLTGDVVLPIGDLSNLTTTVKTDLVSAINEAASGGGVQGIGIDTITALTQAEYDAITTKSDTTLYIITDGGGGSLPTYSVTNNLTYVSTNNNTSSVLYGNIYTATLTPDENYFIDTVTVTMGGVDITSSVYNSGVISIPSVTGKVVITAVGDTTLVSYPYLQSDGTAYITLDEAPNTTDIAVEITTAHIDKTTDTTNKYIIGANSYNGLYFEDKQWINFSAFGTRAAYKETDRTNKHTYKSTSTYLYRDGTSVVQRTAGSKTATTKYSLFALTGATNVNAYVKIYNVKIYNGETLIADYTPVEHEGVPCLYDSVGDKYAYNSAGSGALIYGEELGEA